jgi:hypothetical protein
VEAVGTVTLSIKRSVPHDCSDHWSLTPVREQYNTILKINRVGLSLLAGLWKLWKRDKVQWYVPAESKMEQSWFLPSKTTVYCQCFKLIKVKTFQFIQIWGIYDNQPYQLGFIYLVSGDSTIALDRSAMMKQMLLSTSISQLFRCYYWSKNPTLLIHHHEH